MGSEGHSRRGDTVEPETDGSRAPLRRDVFEVLSNKRRQYVLYYLNENEESVDMSDLVDHVAAWETGTPIDDVDPAERKRVYNALRQTHLPKLDDTGVLEYDRETNEIELTEATRDVQRYLEYVPGNQIPWHAVYLGLSVIAAMLVGASWLEVFPFGELPGPAVGGMVLAAFSISAIVHTLTTRSKRIDTDGWLDILDG